MLRILLSSIFLHRISHSTFLPMKIGKTVILISALIFLCSIPGKAQNNSSDTQPLNPVHISLQNNPNADYAPSSSQLGLQFGYGVLFGAAGVFAGGLSGYAAIGFNDDLGSLGPVLLGSSTGYLFGSALGIYLAANSHSYDASYGYILMGNIAGLGVGAGTIALSENHIDNTGIVSIFALSSVILGGMLANKLSIKKHTNHPSALLNITNGAPQLNTPSIRLTDIRTDLRPNPKDKFTVSPTIKLLNISL